jgi:hypothetical protein
MNWPDDGIMRPARTKWSRRRNGASQGAGWMIVSSARTLARSMAPHWSRARDRPDAADRVTDADVRRITAMEPAEVQLDDPLVFTQIGPVPLPQWSRPKIGQMTRRSTPAPWTRTKRRNGADQGNGRMIASGIPAWLWPIRPQ